MSKEFLDVYKDLRKDNLHTLLKMYTDDITFIDPAHHVHGILNLKKYFSTLFQNVKSVQFTFQHVMEFEKECYLQWKMSLSHRKYGGAKPIIVAGATFLQFAENGKVYHHRDYFDLGAMVYEQLPLLGRLVISIKRRLGK